VEEKSEEKLPKFNELDMMEVKDGSTVMLLQDKWSTEVWQKRLPELYSYQ
jgi:hypothetical protein